MLQGNGSTQHNQGPGLAALYLAQQIRARYGRHARRAPAVVRHWLRLRPAVAYLARHHHIHMQTRLSLTVMAWPPANNPTSVIRTISVASAVPALPVSPAWQPRLMPVVVRSTQTLGPGAHSSREQLLRSVHWHTEAVERWQPQEDPGQQVLHPLPTTPRIASPRVKPVPRVLRQSTAPLREPAMRTAGSPSGASSERQVSQNGSEVVSPPPLNIGDVTNQVLQQLDRRLQAHRERHGQV